MGRYKTETVSNLHWNFISGIFYFLFLFYTFKVIEIFFYVAYNFLKYFNGVREGIFFSFQNKNIQVSLMKEKD